MLHETVRAGNAALAEAGLAEAVRAALADVRAMTGVLGVDPLDPKWGERRSTTASARRSTASSPSRSTSERAARERKDYAAADADP